ncbi:putative RNA-binding family protein [Melia azedarach]|uniref:RNA-binding family protein n=1 Tax=Melia azedarach TaxID=155640 RepID=A0ACC1XC70_MELAZ|nr:putative RNA-binding family protein [Melia azedarach]
MTIDDESSVYVGGLPYSATEDSVRRVFNLYGSVVAVKIVNDRSTKGKCYGFVTFTNPRSAIDAINDMNGRTIDGRAVRVNEVTTRGGKSNSGREQFQHSDRDKGRERERDNDRHRDRYRDRYSDRSRERTPSRESDKNTRRGYEHLHHHDQSKDCFSDKDQDRDLDNDVQGQSRNHELEWGKNSELDQNREREIDGTNGYHRNVDDGKDYLLRKHSGSTITNRHIGELSSNTSDNYDDQISQMEEKVGEKEQLVLDLQKRSKKLEEALVNAKKLSSHRQKHLTKLYKCFVQAKESAERLKSCEQELQSIVDTTMIESDMADEVGV